MNEQDIRVICEALAQAFSTSDTRVTVKAVTKIKEEEK